jgi:CRP/FNR family transcriptional regulator, cyclic AMP receptor protein
VLTPTEGWVCDLFFNYCEAPVPHAAIDILRRVPLFENLPETDLQSFAELARERSYPRGSVIVFEDDPGDALYVVATGQVKVVLVAEDGREVILSVLGPGDFFGEMAILDDGPRSAHVIAMEESNLLILRRDDFYARIRAMPEVAISLLKEISRRLRRADEKIGSLVLLDVNGRLAHLLLRLAEEEQGDRITRRLTHHTIAQMIGSSRETVSRAMRGLVERSVIEVTRSDILLRDRTALRSALRRERATAVPRPA